MIAISVFSIGILVVLQMIIKNLSVVDTVKLRSSATLLAKEWIEIAFNIRDANLDKWLNWDCLLNNDLYTQQQWDLGVDSNICAETFSLWLEKPEDEKIIQLSFSPNQYIYSHWLNLENNFTANFENNILYAYTGNAEDHSLAFYSNEKLKDWENKTNSFFSRYIVFKPVIENGKMLPTDKILKIESHVLIRKGWYTWAVMLESFIGNY